MLAVMASPAAQDRALVLGLIELRFSEDCRDRRPIFVLELARIGCDAAIDQGLKHLVDFEQLRHEAPVPVETLGHASCALFRAVAQPNGDFARTIARHLLFSTWQHMLFQRLTQSSDRFLVEFASKAVKEVAYHRELSSEWTVRLGDGTEESARRMTEGLDWCWRFVPELFEVDESLQALIANGMAPDPREFEDEYRAAIANVLAEAKLEIPADQRPILGGRRGHHSEHLGHLLAVMQFLPRTYPDATW